MPSNLPEVVLGECPDSTVGRIVRRVNVGTGRRLGDTTSVNPRALRTVHSAGRALALPVSPPKTTGPSCAILPPMPTVVPGIVVGHDHFHTVPVPTDEATHEAWTLMAAYAATTSRVKLGQMCTAMSYRNPAYLAKVAATADIISGGSRPDGHRRRVVRARVACLRLRLPVGGGSTGAVDEGVMSRVMGYT